MMEAALEPDLDAYGIQARRSALADVIELQALLSPSLSEAELADYVRDSGWLRRLGEPFRVPGQIADVLAQDYSGEFGADDVQDEVQEERLSPAVERSRAFADEVFAELGERAALLGSEYPFSLLDARLTYTGPNDYQHPYVTLLGITVAHSYRLPLEFDPRRYFEDVVAESLRLHGLRAANVAGARRGVSNLASALAVIGTACELSPTPEAAVTRVAAQEEGVDVVGHLVWGDTRPVHWVCVVQATCAVSDEWRYKLKEPAVPMWKKLLGLSVKPLAALAVPHHVSRDILAYLVEQDDDRFVLDRIRLYHPGLVYTREAQALVQALLAASERLDLRRSANTRRVR